MTIPVVPPVSQTSISAGDRRWALMSWILPVPVSLIILLADDLRRRPFVRDHAVQALALAALNLVQLLVFVWLFGLGLVFLLVIWLYGVVIGIRALRGKNTVLPLITRVCRRRGWITA